MNAYLDDAIKFLQHEQAKDGSFVGGAGSSIADFKSERLHPTIFFTALIAWCLRDIPETQQLKRRASKYLISQKSAHWSWNYWQRSSQMAKDYPYPDDLDDTARALMGLASFDPKLVDGTALAGVAKLLIATESKPGGPYRTWLAGPDMQKDWGDVDIAVNANIGAMLALNKVNLPRLNQYIDESIVNDQLTSPYYVGKIPIIYFLSGWYSGVESARLKRFVSRELSQPTKHNSLMLALLIIAGVNLKLDRDVLAAGSRGLLKLRQQGHWPAEALYADPMIKGVKYFAGSSALTTAFAVEALMALDNLSVSSIARPKKLTNHTTKQALSEGKQLPPVLRSQYRSAVQVIDSRDKDGQITRIADIAAAAYGRVASEQTIAHLNLASLNGWLAYSIYDDFLDDEGQPVQLSVANVGHRLMMRHFYAALPGDGFNQLVERTVDLVDAANTWEVQHARAKLSKNKLSYKLPDYARYAQLAEKSLGHMLASVGVAIASGYNSNASEVLQLQKFFRHFLIARQLNDDAHDWEADLKNGHLSAVVTMLLKSYGAPESVNLNSDLKPLRLHFWQTTINELSGLINKHLSAACLALTKTGMKDPAVFQSWLDALQAAADQARSGSQETQKFIKSYQK